MSHPSQLQLSMHADQALPADEAEQVAAHVAACAECAAQLSALQQETRHISATLELEADQSAEVVIPKFKQPATLRSFALANVATGLAIWLAQFLWKTIFGELVMNTLDWLTSIYLPDIYAMASATALYLLEEGTAMLDAYLGFIVVTIVIATVLWLVAVRYKHRSMVSLCVLAGVVAAMVMPPPAQALEIRRAEGMVAIPASETIDDTLIVAAESILIEGTVTGDVFAAGASIDVSGKVGGNLIAAGESIDIRGAVGGVAMGAASSIELTGASIGGDLWAASSSTRINRDSTVGGNATTATQSTTVNGAVGKELTAFSESVEINGSVARDVEAFANRMRLLGDAHIGGDLRFRTSSEDRLLRADSARVDGEVEFLDIPEEFKERNRYATVQFYLWQVAELIAGLLVGLAALWLVPGLRDLNIGAGVEGLKSAGVGLLVMVSVPSIAAIVAITLVGLPFALIGIAVWLLGLYMAKILIGIIVGQMVLGEDASTALTVLLGLTAVIVAINLPFIGGIINFILTIVGLGLLVQYVYRQMPGRGAAQPVG